MAQTPAVADSIEEASKEPSCRGWCNFAREGIRNHDKETRGWSLAGCDTDSDLDGSMAGWVRRGVFGPKGENEGQPVETRSKRLKGTKKKETKQEASSEGVDIVRAVELTCL
jgi:hypothetical protein